MNTDPELLRQAYLGDIDRVLSAPILSRFISADQRGRLYGMQGFLQAADTATLQKLASYIPNTGDKTMESKTFTLPTLQDLIAFAEKFLVDLVTSEQVQKWFATLGPWLTQLLLSLLSTSKQKKACAPKTCAESCCCCCKEAALGIAACQDNDCVTAVQHFVNAAVDCTACCDSNCTPAC